MSQNVQITTALPSNNVTRDQLIESIESIVPRSAFTDNSTLGVDSQKIIAKPIIPRWTKISKTYTDFATAGTTSTINLFTVAAGTIIHSVKVKHSATFTGGGVTAATLSVGISGSLTKYVNAHNVFQATGDTVQAIGPSAPTAEDHANTVTTQATLTTTTANTNALTSGTVDIWILYSQAI